LQIQIAILIYNISTTHNSPTTVKVVTHHHDFIHSIISQSDMPLYDIWW